MGAYDIMNECIRTIRDTVLLQVDKKAIGNIPAYTNVSKGNTYFE